MVVPPDFHGDQRLIDAQAAHVRLRPRVRALLRHASATSCSTSRVAEVDSARSTSRPGSSSSATSPVDGSGEPRRHRAPTRALRRAVAADASPTTRCRAVADELRATRRGGLGAGRADQHAACTSTSRYECGVTTVEHDRRGSLGRAARRVPGLRPLHGRDQPPLRPARPLRLRPPARRGRHARLGRGAGAAPEDGEVSRDAVRPDARPPRRPAATSRSPSAATTATCRRPPAPSSRPTAASSRPRSARPSCASST